MLPAIAEFLPRKGLRLQAANDQVRWTDRLMVITAILMSWRIGATTLSDAFEQTWTVVTGMYPTRRRVGHTYSGFIKALRKRSDRLLGIVIQSFRGHVEQVDPKHWMIDDRVVMSVDGTKIDTPRTVANEKAFGCAGRRKTGPQLQLTAVLHVGTGLLWDWRRGAGTDAERNHLREMIAALPAGALLLADAGFTGFDLLQELLTAGHSFVIRAGGNLHLLKKLGYRVREHDGIVYLWPEAHRNQKPLVLRHVVVQDGRKPVHLLTDILEESELSGRGVAEMYRRRWGVEVFFRSLKRTMSNHTMRSETPVNATVELDWALMGEWMLGLLTAKRLVARRIRSGRRSVSESLRVVGRVMDGRGGLRAARNLHGLGWAVTDSYHRKSVKAPHEHPRKKKHKPTKPPNIRMATASERGAPDYSGALVHFGVELSPTRFLIGNPAKEIATMRELMNGIIADCRKWVKTLADEAKTVRNSNGAEALERRVRSEGQSFLAGLLERLLQYSLQRQEQARDCPCCGRKRRHKGVRPRGLVSSVGHVRMEGPYWYCPHCKTGEHAADALAPESISGVMRELICLMGTTLASFDKASKVCRKTLGVKLDEETIRLLCHREGRRVLDSPPTPPAVPEQADLIGSCDGTMINTRQDGWRELKAYRFEHDSGRHGGAFLEKSEAFVPRLRQAAQRMKAWRAGRLVWVSDAADWINKGVAVQLPMAKRIVDIWHAREHIYEAGRGIYGEGSSKAKAWSARYSEELREYGGRVVWNSLRRVRYRDPSRQAALDALLGYLDRQADRMDYPTYERAGYPISSGPMESFCKQLGQRLKGPGMRWSHENVDPMSALVSLWVHDEWDSYWQKAS